MTNTKVHIYTSQIEAPLLSSIPDSRSAASKAIFDFLLLFHDFNQRSTSNSEADRKTLWKCLSQEIASTFHAFYVKRMKEVFSNVFLRYQSELDAEEPAEPGLSINSRAPHDGKRLVTFGRKILMTAADGDAVQSKLAAVSAAGAQTPSEDGACHASPEQERAKRASVRRERMTAFRA